MDPRVKHEDDKKGCEDDKKNEGKNNKIEQDKQVLCLLITRHKPRPALAGIPGIIC